MGVWVNHPENMGDLAPPFVPSYGVVGGQETLPIPPTPPTGPEVIKSPSPAAGGPYTSPGQQHRIGPEVQVWESRP